MIFSSRGFYRQRLPCCNHSLSNVNQSFFFSLFDLMIRQWPVGFFSIEISSATIREIKLPVFPGETRLTEQNRAELSWTGHREPCDWLCLPTVFCHVAADSGSWLKNAFWIWFMNSQPAEQMPDVCMSLGCLTVSTASLLCVFQASTQSQSHTKFYFNRRPDARHTLIWERDFLRMWAFLWHFSVKLDYATVGLKPYVFKTSTFWIC